MPGEGGGGAGDGGNGGMGGGDGQVGRVDPADVTATPLLLQLPGMGPQRDGLLVSTRLARDVMPAPQVVGTVPTSCAVGRGRVSGEGTE